MPKLFIIAGCNGAGKTTATYTLLPEMLKCDEYLNADEIAKGLCPSDPSSVAIKATKIMLRTVYEMLDKGADFGIETTLATKSLAKTVMDAKKNGYRVTMVYLWLKNPQMAIDRVRLRAASGGHDVASDTITRRYYTSIRNLFHLYIPICDHWTIINNSAPAGQIVAEGGENIETQVLNKRTYNSILNCDRVAQQPEL